MPDFDAIIIGTGQAGPFLAFRLAGAGMKVAVCDPAWNIDPCRGVIGVQL